MEEVVIEHMTPEDLQTVHAWTVLEEWNVTVHDIRAMYDADPSGFFVARKNSEMIGCVCGFLHEDKFGSLGLVIVAKDYRGQGIARLLLQEALRFLGVKDSNRNSCLSGRVNMVQTYSKYGFKTSSWDVVSYFAKPPALQNLTVPATEGLAICPLEEVDRGQLIDYDVKFNLTRRETLLGNIFSKPGSVTMVGVLNGEVVGYGIISPATWGYRIAPMYAETPAIARALVRALLEAVNGASEGLCVESVSENDAFQAIASELNMTEQYRLKRLYTQSELKFDTSKVYGVANTDISII